jgi:hypothetical protein
MESAVGSRSLCRSPFSTIGPSSMALATGGWSSGSTLRRLRAWSSTGRCSPPWAPPPLHQACLVSPGLSPFFVLYKLIIAILPVNPTAIEYYELRIFHPIPRILGTKQNKGSTNWDHPHPHNPSHPVPYTFVHQPNAR